MLKPILLPKKLFYSKARLNIQLFKKILKINTKARRVAIQSIKKLIKPNKNFLKKIVVDSMYLGSDRKQVVNHLQIRP